LVGHTNGVADTVNASGEQFGGSTANGQPTGIGTNSNAQVNVVGSNNGIALDNGSTLGVSDLICGRRRGP